MTETKTTIIDQKYVIDTINIIKASGNYAEAENYLWLQALTGFSLGESKRLWMFYSLKSKFKKFVA